MHHSASRINATNFLGTLALALGLVLAMLALVAGPALANVNNGGGPDNTCDKVGFADNKLNDTTGTNTLSGAWGSASWTNNEKTLHLDINEGWEVEICVKAGDGIERPHTFTVDDETANPAFDHGISHASWRTPVPPGPDPDPQAPAFTVAADCDETDSPIVTVTVGSNPDNEPITVSITDEEDVTITATETFDGDAFDKLTATYGDDVKEATFRDDCGGEELTSTASFTTGTECQAGLPVLTYDASVSEVADDPIGDITITVSDVSGALGQATVSESDAGSLALPTALEGATVNASWDFDDTTTQQTLVDNCAEVQGIVDERDEEPAVDDEPAVDNEPTVDETSDEAPAALPATEVKGEQVASGGQLPNTGVEHVILLLLSSGLFALGGAFLLLSDRRRGVLA